MTMAGSTWAKGGSLGRLTCPDILSRWCSHSPPSISPVPQLNSKSISPPTKANPHSSKSISTLTKACSHYSESFSPHTKVISHCGKSISTLCNTKVYSCYGESISPPTKANPCCGKSISPQNITLPIDILPTSGRLRLVLMSLLILTPGRLSYNHIIFSMARLQIGYHMGV